MLGKGRLVVGVFLVVSVFAQHDHSEHLDTAFIKGEASRVGWMKLDDLLRDLNSYIEALRLIENKYEEYFADPDPADKDRINSIWKKHFEPKYRDTHDRIFIISHVCLDIYNEDACVLPDDIWDDRYDRRGAAFRDEFVQEVHAATAIQVGKVKASWKDL